ncbi:MULTISPECIES: hypothetical protein [Vibrio harveyi group]|uniref:hypothetical protein n=1 Tax=Vibrio harveyi group TaxID=717610 RepID=UPI0015F4F784|nr:hypothetical protein [Vibrio alginolyticus]EJE4208674.1 hypothetical protein [Vibrio parahaemolyticus]HDM8060782.1 hypothetical protein [Vibrio harveyi]
MEIQLEAASGARLSLALSNVTITIQCTQSHSLLEMNLEIIGEYPEAALSKIAGFVSMLSGGATKQPQGEVSFKTDTGIVLAIAHDGEYVRVSRLEDGAELAFYDAVELSGTENAHLVWSELLPFLKGEVI